MYEEIFNKYAGSQDHFVDDKFPAEPKMEWKRLKYEDLIITKEDTHNP